MIANAKPSSAPPPPSPEPVSPDTWRQLYALAAQIRALEPWRWMEETDIFGVRVPDGGETLFVSIMGLLGEYHAVALYPGPGSLAEFWNVQNTPEFESGADRTVANRQVHACFGKKGDLMPAEKRLAAQLGLAFKGAHCWPYFRSFGPGLFPWTVDAAEARWLTLALGQLLEVAPRIQKDRRLLGTGGADRRYLIRVPRLAANGIDWRDAHEPAPPPNLKIQFSVPSALMAGLSALPTHDATVELDVFPSMMRVGEKGERPHMPYLMLAADTESGFVLGAEMIDVDGRIEHLWNQVPAKVIGLLQTARLRPKRLALRADWLANLLDGPCRELNIELIPNRELPAIAAAREGLGNFSR